jgi:thioredoxin reductase
MRGSFCFIGAIPATAWLRDCVSLDRNGFVLTDRSLSDDDVNADAFGGRDPLPFETSLPGVFAVGDVRLGSMKRVAAAVGRDLARSARSTTTSPSTPDSPLRRTPQVLEGQPMGDQSALYFGEGLS